MAALRHLLVVDDDLLSREVLAAVGQEAGFLVDTFDTGEAALAWLALHRETPPSAMLVDMQMPGLHGDALAERLRGLCAKATVLVAMSGSPVAPEHVRHFDSFLLKPFDFDALQTALASAPPASARAASNAERDAVLGEATYESLAQSMTAEQLAGLYKLCLDDADRRVHLLRQAALAGDDDAFRRGAHAIKGGCGMVGALELASLAAVMEDDGPPAVDDLEALDQMMNQFLHASARLRAMLEARPEQPR